MDENKLYTNEISILKINNLTLKVEKEFYVVVNDKGKEWRFYKFEYACYFMIALSSEVV